VALIVLDSLTVSSIISLNHNILALSERTFMIEVFGKSLHRPLEDNYPDGGFCIIRA
jgi:hypothetical protein